MPVVAFDEAHGNDALIAAARFEIVAAGAKVAALRALVRQREVAGDRDKWAGVLVGAGQRDRAEERLRIGVAHLVEDIFDRAALDRLAGIHHADAVAGFEHQPKVVADEQHRGAVFLAEVFDELHHCGFHGHVKRGGRLIKDQ